MKLDKLIYYLCWKHRRCAQDVFNMDQRLCENKYCVMRDYDEITEAYQKTKLKKKAMEKNYNIADIYRLKGKPKV